MAERAFTLLYNNLDNSYKDLGDRDGDLTLFFVLKRYEHRLRTDGTLIESVIGTNNCPSENALSLLNFHACLATLLALKHERALPAKDEKNPSSKLCGNFLKEFGNSRRENQKLFEQYLFFADSEARRVLDDLAQNAITFSGGQLGPAAPAAPNPASERYNSYITEINNATTTLGRKTKN